MRKAAIYARYSTDLQSERSIDDQIALCKGYAVREDMQIVAEFADRAQSSASLKGREGLAAMMAAARRGEFSILLVESLDRISRDLEDLPGVYKRLEYVGVQILGVHEGVADHIQIGLRGLFGAIFLKDLAEKVRRGMAGVTRDGRHAGGRAYGYRAVAGRPGELEIEPSEGEVVQRIFSEYVQGHNPRAIAQRLNTDRIPPPRGEVWSASALTGNASRGHGILLNPLYDGRIVWNRVRMIKNPDTGRRVSRRNPAEEWLTSAAPQLAIVDHKTFELAQKRREGRASQSQKSRRAPKHLLSGLVKCGCCGGGMSIKDRDHGRLRIVCTRARESGSCSNRRSFYLDEIEKRLTLGLRTHLGSPAAANIYINAYNEERRVLSGAGEAEKHNALRRLASIDLELERATKLLIKGVLDEVSGAAEIRKLREERSALERRMHDVAADTGVVALESKAVSDYLKTLDSLDVALRGGSEPEVNEYGPVRDLVQRIVISHTSAGGAKIDFEGDLSRLLVKTYPAGGKVVAEEGFEPPTHGL